MLASVRDAKRIGSLKEATATTQTVASARTSERRNGLAESQHHTAPRGPKMAMARGRGTS